MDLFALPDWIIWGLIAAALLAVEMMTTAYVALGFALGAAAVALVTYFVPGLHIFVQGLIWASVGLAVWLGLSRWNKSRHKSRKDINDFDSYESLPRADRERRDALKQKERD
jgi:membrane protein implicated in regulation of membrane protease activity